MDELSNNPEEGTALEINDAADLISKHLDVPEDSLEHTEEHVEEATSEEVVETPEDQFFDVNGEQISLKDLQSGYLRQQDYTRKTQEIAEQRRQYQENQRDVNQVRVDALAGIEALKQELAVQFRVMEVPDFDFLLENDPAEYVRQKAHWDKREASVRQLYEAEQHIRAKQAEYEKEQHQAALQESNAKFYEKYPDLKDHAKAEDAFTKITSFLIDTGFSKDEIQSISDFRIIDVMYQVVTLLEKQKTVPEVIAKMEQKPVISQKNASRKTGDYDRAKYDQFNKTRSVSDAAALIKQLL